MVDKEIIEDLTEDIVSWGNFFIIAHEDYMNDVKPFQELIEKQNLSCIIILEDMEIEFSEWDVLLAISPEGNESHILTRVEAALAQNTKVYAICRNLESPLSFLAKDVLNDDSSETFGKSVQLVFDEVIWKLSQDVGNADYELAQALPTAPPPKPVKSQMFICILGIAIVFIVIILIFKVLF